MTGRDEVPSSRCLGAVAAKYRVSVWDDTMKLKGINNLPLLLPSMLNLDNSTSSKASPSILFIPCESLNGSLRVVAA